MQAKSRYLFYGLVGGYRIHNKKKLNFQVVKQVTWFNRNTYH